MKKTSHLASALLFGTGAVLASAVFAALPATAADDTAVGLCTVESGTMTWGVKESFRSYISGSIAKGEWQASDGATYETPVFTFAGATGELDAESGSGTITFPGAVHFTGHGGVLDMSLASPSVVIAADGTALLHLDVRSNDTSGETAVDERQAEVGAFEAPIIVDAQQGAITFADAPVTLTDAGAPAFGGFYEPGDELDPITLDVQLACAQAVEEPAEAAPEEASAVPVDAAPEESEAIPTWMPFTIGGALVVVAVATTGIAIARRRRG